MIEISGLTKYYGKSRALHNVSATIQPGRVSAIIGPNGSGKTTLNKCILGLVKPRAGSVKVNGQAINGEADYRCHIGYMPQYVRYPENLTGNEVLKLLKALRKQRHEDIDMSLVEELSLGAQLKKKIAHLSGGTRQKLGAVVACLFKPKILIFDEPTAGLDPISRKTVQNKIVGFRDEGRTIILTSHFLTEIEVLADDIIFLLDGQVAFAGPIGVLREKTGENRLDDAVAALLIQAKSNTQVSNPILI